MLSTDSVRFNWHCWHQYLLLETDRPSGTVIKPSCGAGLQYGGTLRVFTLRRLLKQQSWIRRGTTFLLPTLMESSAAPCSWLSRLRA